MPVLNVSTYIITSNTAYSIGFPAMIVIMSVLTFFIYKTKGSPSYKLSRVQDKTRSFAILWEFTVVSKYQLITINKDRAKTNVLIK
jgi:hypothetical protein